MFETNLSDAAKKRFALLGSLLLVALILFVGAKFINEVKSSRYLGQGISPAKILTVVAEEEIVVKPDIARVSFAVVKRATAATAAQQQNSEALNRVVAFLKKAGVEEKDVKTQNYNISPLYDYIRDQGQVFKGYEVRQELRITIRNLDKAGEILTGAAENGANEIIGFGLAVDEEEKIRDLARTRAIAKARTKAEILAKSLGVRLGQLVNFSENGNGIYPMSVEYGRSLGVGGGDAKAVPEIPIGENKIVVNVILTYEMK